MQARRHHKQVAGLAQDLVLADPGAAELMFDDRLYKRGALALHALRLTLRDDTFFAMLRAWVAEHRLGTVSTVLFEEHVARFGSVGDLLVRWLHRVPLPDLPEARL